MDLKVELNETDVKYIVKKYLEENLNRYIEDTQIKMEVKSKQNYKSEWETAAFRVTYSSSKL